VLERPPELDDSDEIPDIAEIPVIVGATDAEGFAPKLKEFVDAVGKLNDGGAVETAVGAGVLF
jgi:hypothetical protein